MSPVVVVTGGSAGVGRAAVREFARNGYDVAVLARGEDGIEGAAQDVERLGRGALPLAVDVADADAVDAAAEQVEQQLGPIDVWVNNAMASVFAPTWEVSPEEFRRATEVTYLGEVYGTMAALKRMRARDRGVIVQVGSALAYRGIPLQAAYCGAKHAVVGFTESLRTDLLHDHSRVQVTMVHLPAMDTPQFGWVLSRLPRHPQPVPPIYQPEVAARVLVHAAAHPRRAYWVGAPTVLTIIGNRLAPNLLDHYLASHGVSSQQTTDAPPMRGTNLWEPVPGDVGPHGVFGSRSKRSSVQAWASVHRRGLLGASAAVAGGALAAAVRGHDGQRGNGHRTDGGTPATHQPIQLAIATEADGR